MKLQTPLSLTTKQNYLKDKKNSSTISSFLEEFFKDNKETLLKCYPGLKQKFFQEEFLRFSESNSELNQFDPFFQKSWKVFLGFLEEGRPFEYINKLAFFFDSYFYVDERVLIPRFETEVLLEQAFIELNSFSVKAKERIQVCEVGVGPGTIGLSLLKGFSRNAIDFIGTDISDDALAVASINKFRMEAVISSKHKISLIQGDRLSDIQESFDLIVTNPPYIKEKEDKSLVHKMVLRHEPPIALFLQDETYDMWFRTFFQQVNDSLNNGGLFLMEGHESHLTHLKEVCDEYIISSESVVINDLTGAPRLLKVRKRDG